MYSKFNKRLQLYLYKIDKSISSEANKFNKANKENDKVLTKLKMF
jgi:hypothetical protein